MVKRLTNLKRQDPLARSDATPPGVQTVAGSILGSGETFFSGDLVMKSFLQSFSPYSLTQVGQLSDTGERMSTKYWLTRSKICTGI